jgi:hypothetical protein
VLLQLQHERVHFKQRKRFFQATLYVRLYQINVTARHAHELTAIKGGAHHVYTHD